MGEWVQAYDPAGSFYVSVTAAAVPLVLLLGLIGGLKVRSHEAARPSSHDLVSFGTPELTT